MDMQEFIHEHRLDDVRELMLHAGRYPDIDMRRAAVQIEAWQRARAKLPLWAATEGIIFPEQLPMEQCSSEQTGRYKRAVLTDDARRALGGDAPFLVTDLTGGFGVDATMICREAENVSLTFVERNDSLCELARHNLPLLGVRQVNVRCADSEQLLADLPHQHLIFVDPARRNTAGGRTVAIADCTPDVSRLNELLLSKADCVAIKLSPMLDIKQALRQLRGVAEVHVVSLDGECKELLFVLSPQAAGEPSLHCVNLRIRETDREERFSFRYSEESAASCPLANEPRQYLYEPNASLLKAGAYRCLAARFGMEKLHPSSHLYTSDAWVEDFPGRKFAVKAFANFSKKELKPLLAGMSQANLAVRNFPLSVVELRRRLKLKDGGSDYLFATTLADARHVVVRCDRL